MLIYTIPQATKKVNKKIHICLSNKRQETAVHEYDVYHSGLSRINLN